MIDIITNLFANLYTFNKKVDIYLWTLFLMGKLDDVVLNSKYSISDACI